MTRLAIPTLATLLATSSSDAPIRVASQTALGTSGFVEQSLASSPLATMALLTVLSLVPFALLMLTCFSKLAVVLSIARSAFGTPQIPPTTVVTGLALLLSVHIMSPVLGDMWSEGRRGLESARNLDEVLGAAEAAGAPLKGFLARHAHADDREMFVDLARQLRAGTPNAEVSEDHLLVIAPAFMISELKEAFEVGFLVFLPFLVVDMVIANILMALGMQSLSPSSVSLPFKLLLFVAIDGWRLLAQGLVLGYR